MVLIQTGQTWQFSSELDLEEAVWRNLAALLNVQPLHRQFAISGQFCDLLAVDASNQLVIIELKNTEDRYVVQQSFSANAPKLKPSARTNTRQVQPTAMRLQNATKAFKKEG